MSAQAHSQAEMASVTSMRGFLRAFLHEAMEVDGHLHEAMHRVRERIYALELAEDEQFLAEHRQFSEAIAAGEISDEGLTASEFAGRYLVR